MSQPIVDFLYPSWTFILRAVGLGSGGGGFCKTLEEGNHEEHGKAARLGGFGGASMEGNYRGFDITLPKEQVDGAG